MGALASPLERSIHTHGVPGVVTPGDATPAPFNPNLDTQVADDPTKPIDVVGLWGLPVDAGLDERFTATYSVLTDALPEGIDLLVAQVTIDGIHYTVGTVRSRIWKGEAVGKLMGLVR